MVNKRIMGQVGEGHWIVCGALYLILIGSQNVIHAGEVTPLYVEDGNIQVNKVVVTNPLGGTTIEYAKTKTENTQELSRAAQSNSQPAGELKQSNIAAITSAKLPVKTVVREEAGLLSDDSRNSEQKDIFVTKSRHETPKAKALLEKIKEKQKQTQKYAELNNDLQLLPGEQLVKPSSNSKLKRAKNNRRQTRKVVSKENLIIDKLEFTSANILDVARALADISGLNFVATEKAAKKNVTVFLQNISVKHALETITKNSGLWYRKDKQSGAYRIMSTDEYARDLIFYREDVTRVFRLLHPNPMMIATTIQDLYGKRVVLSYGMFDDTTMRSVSSGSSSSGVGRSNNSRGSSNRNNSSQSGRGGASQKVQTLNEAKQVFSKQATVSQLESLAGKAEAVGNQDAIGLDKLGAVTTNEQPIYVALNREQDLMIVRTSDVAVMKDIEALVKQLDLPTKQVLLEMKILSLDIGDFYRRAMDLDYMPNGDTLQGPLTDQAKNPLGTIAPITVTSTETVGGTTQTQNGVINLGVSHILGLGNFALEGGTFVYQFLSDKIRARIQLLQQNNRIQTLSSPILLTTNKKPARVFVGTEQVVTTGFEAVAGVSNGLVATNPAIVPVTEIRDIGNTLQVQPNINGDKTVTLLIKQDASSLVRGGSTIPIPVGNTVQSFNVDSVRTSNIQGTVVAKDGLTIAIGGLIDASDTEDIQKVPVIGDFPIIGEFFKRKVKEKSKRELILLITPHIIESPNESDDISRDVIEPITEHEW